MRTACVCLFMCAVVAAAAPSPAPLDDEAKAHGWRMLDTRARARAYALWDTIPITEREFREMQRRYRPEQFNVCAALVRQIRRGMTEHQITTILRPKRAPIPVFLGGGLCENIELDDAYFVAVFLDERTNRMLWATTPLAITYEIKPSTPKD